jgi:hypothetical protein
LDYIVSDKLPKQQITYTLFDGAGCQEKSSPIDVHNNDYLQSNIALHLPTTSDGSQRAEISFQVDPEAIASSPIYREIDGSRAEILFCVRFSLYTGDPSEDPNAMEVNFLETPVLIHVQVQSGFEIDLVEESLKRVTEL